MPLPFLIILVEKDLTFFKQKPHDPVLDVVPARRCELMRTGFDDIVLVQIMRGSQFPFEKIFT